MHSLRSALASILLLSPCVFVSQAQAVTYDLSAGGTVAVDTLYGRAYFTTQYTSTGAATATPFLGLDADGAEQGFNGQAGNSQVDPNNTRLQRLSDFQTVTVAGTQYYAFLIEASEPGGTKTPISLDLLKIYTSSGLGAAVNALGLLDTTATLRFSLDDPTDASIGFKDTGLVGGDLGFFIPTAAFLGVSSNDYVYVLEGFSGADHQGNDDTTRAAGDITFTPVPETNAIAPMLAVLGVIVAGPFVRRVFHP